MNLKKLTQLAFVIILAIATPVLLTACDGGSIGSGSVITQQDCEYDNNLSETADSYISRCRKAGIRRTFPGEYYEKTLGEIDRDKSADGKKVKKLLNDGRFKK
ncbi:MAG: hypothetical protein DCF15_20250 [Phormidesmis priestleyi]|uniref:Entry exclusion lipoprotein TrbK n=1 Tax=Phormidesmis priestleyi TaxID=268141 RepID=A0A2W4WMP8_9CYAN|nr:MAG: hypothetical protein DCF15_20250 [Phormidesmis priestleyi]